MHIPVNYTRVGALIPRAAENPCITFDSLKTNYW